MNVDFYCLQTSTLYCSNLCLSFIYPCSWTISFYYGVSINNLPPKNAQIIAFPNFDPFCKNIFSSNCFKIDNLLLKIAQVFTCHEFDPWPCNIFIGDSPRSNTLLLKLLKFSPFLHLIHLNIFSWLLCEYWCLLCIWSMLFYIFLSFCLFIHNIKLHQTSIIVISFLCLLWIPSPMFLIRKFLFTITMSLWVHFLPSQFSFKNPIIESARQIKCSLHIPPWSEPKFLPHNIRV